MRSSGSPLKTAGVAVGEAREQIHDALLSLLPGLRPLGHPCGRRRAERRVGAVRTEGVVPEHGQQPGDEALVDEGPGPVAHAVRVHRQNAQQRPIRVGIERLDARHELGALCVSEPARVQPRDDLVERPVASGRCQRVAAPGRPATAALFGGEHARRRQYPVGLAPDSDRRQRSAAAHVLGDVSRKVGELRLVQSLRQEPAQVVVPGDRPDHRVHLASEGVLDLARPLDVAERLGSDAESMGESMSVRAPVALSLGLPVGGARDGGVVGEIVFFARREGGGTARGVVGGRARRDEPEPRRKAVCANELLEVRGALRSGGPAQADGDHSIEAEAPVLRGEIHLDGESLLDRGREIDDPLGPVGVKPVGRRRPGHHRVVATYGTGQGSADQLAVAVREHRKPVGKRGNLRSSAPSAGAQRRGRPEEIVLGRPSHEPRGARRTESRGQRSPGILLRLRGGVGVEPRAFVLVANQVLVVSVDRDLIGIDSDQELATLETSLQA